MESVSIDLSIADYVYYSIALSNDAKSFLVVFFSKQNYTFFP